MALGGRTLSLSWGFQSFSLTSKGLGEDHHTLGRSSAFLQARARKCSQPHYRLSVQHPSQHLHGPSIAYSGSHTAHTMTPRFSLLYSCSELHWSSALHISPPLGRSSCGNTPILNPMPSCGNILSTLWSRHCLEVY